MYIIEYLSLICIVLQNYLFIIQVRGNIQGIKVISESNPKSLVAQSMGFNWSIATLLRFDLIP